MKRDEDNPLQVIGIKAEYTPEHEDIYSDRREIAREISEEESVPVEEIIDVKDPASSIDPVPTGERYEDISNTYEFVIVDTNPEHSFDVEDDFMEYSSILESEGAENYTEEIKAEKDTISAKE
ncbi:MAG: hypothetical protein ABEJ36_02155 [Candidatus Nanosalina sp.]